MNAILPVKGISLHVSMMLSLSSLLCCRHLNADEFQFVANGSNIEIGNFLQDGKNAYSSLW